MRYCECFDLWVYVSQSKKIRVQKRDNFLCMIYSSFVSFLFTMFFYATIRKEEEIDACQLGAEQSSLALYNNAASHQFSLQMGATQKAQMQYIVIHGKLHKNKCKGQKRYTLEVFFPMFFINSVLHSALSGVLSCVLSNVLYGVLSCVLSSCISNVLSMYPEMRSNFDSQNIARIANAVQCHN